MQQKILSAVIGLSLGIFTTNLTMRESAAESLFGPSETYNKVPVARVLTVDTFLLENGEKIKMIGLSAPAKPRKKEVKKDKYGFVIEEFNPETPLEEKAFDFAKQLLEGKEVRLEFDNEKKSPDFETWAYVFLTDKTFVNAEILRQGFANLNLTPANQKYDKELRGAYQEAHREKRGLQGQ